METQTDEQFKDRITEITALITDVEGAESLDELREIMSSEMKYGKGPMHNGGHRNMQNGKAHLQKHARTPRQHAG